MRTWGLKMIFFFNNPFFKQTEQSTSLHSLALNCRAHCSVVVADE